MPAAVQRNAIAAFHHRFTLRQTRRTVPIMFSIELVQASEAIYAPSHPWRLGPRLSRVTCAMRFSERFKASNSSLSSRCIVGVRSLEDPPLARWGTNFRYRIGVN
jgi:hypothetical protein